MGYNRISMKGHVMKVLKEYVLPVGIGLLGNLLIAFVIFGPWMNLGWRKPAADWMVDIGLSTTIAGYWGLVWVNLPDWMVAIALGIVTGTMRRHSSWLRFSLFACVGFILIPSLLYWLATGFYVWHIAPSNFLWTVVITFSMSAVSVALLLGAAWLAHRSLRPSKSKLPDQSDCQSA